MNADENPWPWAMESRADDATDTLARAAARALSGADGEQLARYLRAITLDRALGPDATIAQLRHLEGQRQLVRHVLALAERGRA